MMIIQMFLVSFFFHVFWHSKTTLYLIITSEGSGVEVLPLKFQDFCDISKIERTLFTEEKLWLFFVDPGNVMQRNPQK